MGGATMRDFDSYLDSVAIELAPLEVMQSPPSVLLGVSDEVADLLKDLGIKTVFDLASSRLFANAALLVDAARNPRSVVARMGLAPTDVVAGLPADVTVANLQHQAIGVLDGVPADREAEIKEHLDVASIRELALWPPYVAAVEMLRDVFFPDTAPSGDLEAPSDLVPRSGDYPTERVFFSTLVLDPLDEQPGATPIERAGQVDVAPAAAADFGFKKPAVGALLTFSQSWYAQGVSLGQLLHSVALAPGESTRIAMIDWSRRTSGRQAEDVTETEQLTNVTEHSRALGEVTSAVASEAQSGFSESKAQSASSEGGAGLGFSAGPITIGATGSSAGSETQAMSFSSSSGRRDLSAAMSQNILDRTQQQANAARNRRATVVKEVSQSEHEAVSTRVVANYNHMHALSVAYYEVVQIYRVSVQLARVTKCLFVPMKLLDFTNAELVRQFRRALAAAPVEPEAAELLTTNYDTVEMKAQGASLLELKNPFGYPALTKGNRQIIELPNEAILTQIWIGRSRGGINDLPPLSTLTINLRDGGIVTPVREGGAPGPNDKSDTMKAGAAGVAVFTIDSIVMACPAGPEDHKYFCTFTYQYKAGTITVDTEILVDPGASRTVMRFSGGGIRQLLVDHLVANRLHYSQAVFRSLDASTASLLLSSYTYRGKPLVSQIDPNPVTVAGNYVAFKVYINPDLESQDPEEREWAEWLAAHGVDRKPHEDLVPLPSGGVFAEAVLGRFNSAEKLDVTRFWNWQDSPIPLQAPDIAAIATGSRGTSEDLKAQPLSQPLVNIVSPTALPDPTGMGAVLTAIANGNMFRDMSGLAATIGLAQAGLQTTSEAAGRAGAQAGANLVTAAQKEVEMAKTAVAAMQAMMGNPNAQAGSGANISQQGAMINHGRSMDARGVGAASGGGTTGSLPSGGSEGSPGDPGGTPAGEGAGGGSADGGGGEMVHVERGPNELEATRASLWPPLGESPSGFFQKAAAMSPDGADGGSGGATTTGVTVTLPPVAAPSPIAFPPVANMPGPSGYPAMPATCPGAFFGDPPTRNQSTSGTQLTPSEVTKRTAAIRASVAASKSTRPLSAANIEHWLDGAGATLVMSTSSFNRAESGVPAFLANKARSVFENGVTARLKQANHPQGSLLPTGNAVGSQGPIRFLQYRDGVKPEIDTEFGKDLFTAVGDFNVHIALWAQATYTGTEGGFLGLGSKKVYRVDILKSCVQIYDVYDWNKSASTPFPVSDADLAKVQQMFPPQAMSVTKLAGGLNMVQIADSYFRDLEVSGGGRAYLIRTDAFPLPSATANAFVVKI